MKLKYLFFAVFFAALVLSSQYFLADRPYLAALLLVALASALNASGPTADKQTHFNDIVRLFVEQK